MKKTITPEMVDELLPQTQCGLCGYGACLPYANALVQGNAPINLCPPGGLTTLQALGDLLQQDALPFKKEMLEKAKKERVATIREAECIGCTKCIQACPVDAIIGAAKMMHTVINELCTGCDLCVSACPVDCIDMHENVPMSLSQKNMARRNYRAKQMRLEKNKQKENNEDSMEISKKEYLKNAILRVRNRKLS